MGEAKPLLVMAVSGICVLSACDNSKSASEAGKQAAGPERRVGDNAANAQQKADARIASARADPRDEQRDLQHSRALQGPKVADRQAEGDYEVALARCESLSGANQKACEDQASADFDLATARIKRDRSVSDPGARSSE
jgi:hypothetical protein